MRPTGPKCFAKRRYHWYASYYKVAPLNIIEPVVIVLGPCYIRTNNNKNFIEIYNKHYVPVYYTEKGKVKIYMI